MGGLAGIRAVFEGPVFGVGTGGGDTSKVKDALARCNVSTIVSNILSYAALCSDRTVIAWGSSWSTACLFRGSACMGKQDGQGSQLRHGKGERPVHEARP